MAVTFTPGSDAGTLDGTNVVTIVPAPGSGVKRTVRSLRMVNKDSATVDIRVRKTVGGTPYELDNVSGLAVDGKFDPIGQEDIVNLTDTDESITALMGGAASTNNPTWVVSWFDYSES